MLAAMGLEASARAHCADSRMGVHGGNRALGEDFATLRTETVPRWHHSDPIGKTVQSLNPCNVERLIRKMHR